MKYLSLLLMLALTQLLSGQDLQTELQKINAAYSELDKLSIEMSFSVYGDWQKHRHLQTESGKLDKRGSDLYYKVGDLEYLSTPDYHLLCDHEQRQIAILKVFGQQVSPQLEQIIPLLQMTIDQLESFSLEQISEYQRRWTLNLPAQRSTYARIIIEYDTRRYYITALRLYYGAAQPSIDSTLPPRMDIEYYRINDQPVFQSSDFSISRFLRRSSSGFKAQHAYASYEVIDQYSSY
ncbi:MAG: hypothetical protein AAFR36_16795 [Bacteroidota bacterium]